MSQNLGDVYRTALNIRYLLIVHGIVYKTLLQIRVFANVLVGTNSVGFLVVSFLPVDDSNPHPRKISIILRAAGKKRPKRRFEPSVLMSG